MRHGQSLWNLENRFTGWANVELSDHGRREAARASQMLLSADALHIDVCYTSVLRRSVETAEIMLDVYEAAGRRRPAMISRWRLNERHYGALTGLNKREALEVMDAADLQRWRHTFNGRPPPIEPHDPHYSRTPARYERLLDASAAEEEEPLRMDDVPLTESLADTVERVRPLWEKELLPVSGQRTEPRDRPT